MRTVSQRELRNDSGEIMRQLDQGESFLVTRNGVPVGELTPLKRRQFVPVDHVAAAFRGAASIDREQFFRDIDAFVDSDANPRE